MVRSSVSIVDANDTPAVSTIVANDNAPMPTSARIVHRVLYLDGLRGVAIGLVLVYHAWVHSGPTGVRALDFIAVQCAQGVALFLVLSGFCLSYPAFQRHRNGSTAWFVPSTFFSRRILRIIPPYYVALALFVALKVYNDWHHTFTTLDPPVDMPNVLTHLLLIHNVTPYIYTINGPFWSLGLEWQWYWVFPIILLLALRQPINTALGCILVALTWHLVTNDLWGLGALPARMFEFTAGVIVARQVVDGSIPGQRLLIGVLLGTLILLAAPYDAASGLGTLLAAPWFTHLLWGTLFATFLLLGASNRLLNTALSWKPLYGLGLVSYSVYLVHQPILDFVIDHVRHIPILAHHSVLIGIIGLASGILAGITFCFLVERPCMQRERWDRLIPHLVQHLRWTDALWAYLATNQRGIGSLIVPEGIKDSDTLT